MRIVSLLSSATEWLFALDLGQQVLAVSHECDYPPAALTLPKATRSLIDTSKSSGQIDDQVKSLSAAGGALYGIEDELICRLRPDLIVTQAQCDVCAVRYIDVIDLVQSRPELAAARVVPLNPSSFDEILRDVLHVGMAAGVPARAQNVYDLLVQRRLAISVAAARLAQVRRPQVAIIEWTDPLMIAGNWTPDVVHDAGGQSVLARPGKYSEYASWDALVASRPDVLVVAPCGFDLDRSRAEARRLSKLPGFSDLPAVRERRAFVLDGNAYLNRSGPRIIDSLELLAWMIHPTHFPLPEGELAEGRAWARLL